MTDHFTSPSGQAFGIRVQTKSNQAEINCIFGLAQDYPLNKQ